MSVRHLALRESRAARLDDGKKGLSNLPEEKEKPDHIELRDGLEEAFVDAYPDVPRDEVVHMARNLAQVITGTIDIGDKVGAAGDVSHMDVANAFVYWCTFNTYLEDVRKGNRNPALTDTSSPRLSEGEMKLLTGEFVARAADLLLGLEVLQRNPEMFKAFIRGSLALGASQGERHRGNLAR